MLRYHTAPEDPTGVFLPGLAVVGHDIWAMNLEGDWLLSHGVLRGRCIPPELMEGLSVQGTDL